MIEARKEIEIYFDKLGVDYSGKDTRQILVDYFSLKHKLISNSKRTVLSAKHLQEKVNTLGLKEIFDEILKKIAKGRDLNPHLSKGVLKPSKHDFILNEWKLHHLHLTNLKKNESDYFFVRGDFLLFMHVQDYQIYLIDIIPHSDRLVFAKKDFIRIVKENWSDLHDKFLFGDGEMQLLDDLSEEDIANYRRQPFGVLMVTQVDNQTYMPGLGSTTSGHSLEAMRNMDGFHRQLWDIQNQLIEKDEFLKKSIKKKKGLTLNKLHFTVKLENGLFRIFEKNSKSYIA